MTMVILTRDNQVVGEWFQEEAWRCLRCNTEHDKGMSLAVFESERVQDGTDIIKIVGYICDEEDLLS